MPASVIPPDALYALHNEKIPMRSPSIHTNPQFAYEAVFNDSKVRKNMLDKEKCQKRNTRTLCRYLS